MASDKNKEFAPTLSSKRVLLLVESTRAYGRGCLTGIAKYVRAHGSWDVVHIERGLDEEIPAYVVTQNFHGVIARLETPQMKQKIDDMGIPAVDLRGVFQPQNGVRFNTDPQSCADLAFQHFSERGFRRLGYCGYPGVDFSDERGSFFRTACSDKTVELHEFSGSKIRSREGIGAGISYTLMQESAGEIDECELVAWLNELPKPIGIFACNDIRGRQVLAAARKANLHVPSQVAVLGVDDDDVICELANPPLSSIEPNVQRLGFEGAETLARLMDGDVDGEKFILIPAVRVSTRQSTDIVSIDDPLVAAAMEYISKNATLGLRVQDVAEKLSTSRATLERRFRDLLQSSPRIEIERFRISRVKALLSETDYSLEKIAAMMAFSSSSHLSIAFRRVTGMTPGQYRKLLDD